MAELKRERERERARDPRLRLHIRVQSAHEGMRGVVLRRGCQNTGLKGAWPDSRVTSGARNEAQ